MCKRLQKALIAPGSVFGTGSRRRRLNYWLQVYRSYEVAGLVADYDLFTRMSMTGKDREVLMDVMPYVIMLYNDTPFSAALLAAVVARNTWAALRDAPFLDAAGLDHLECAGAERMWCAL